MFHAAFWTILARWLTRIGGLVSTLILVRLLEPADFGIAALTTFVVMLANTLTESGANKYVIREQNLSREQLDSVWSLNLFLRCISGFLVILAAYPVSVYMKDERILPVLIISSSISFIVGFRNIALAVQEKEGKFRKISMIPAYAKLLSVPVTLILAFWTRSYWALVIGSIFWQFSKISMGYILCWYRPRFNTKYWKEQWNFSKWIFISSLTGYLRSKIDLFIVGNLFGTSGTGHYSIGREMTSLASSEVVSPANRGFFSITAANQANRKNVSTKLVKQLFLNLTILIPSVVGYFIVDELFIEVVLGAQWVGLKEYFAILAILIIPMNVIGPINTLYVIYNHIRFSVITDLIFIVALTSAAYLFVLSDLKAFVELRVVVGLLFVTLIFISYRVLMGVNLFIRLRFLIIPIILSFLMFVALQSILPIFHTLHFSDLETLCGIAVMGAAMYCLLLFVASAFFRKYSVEMKLVFDLFMISKNHLTSLFRG